MSSYIPLKPLQLQQTLEQLAVSPHTAAKNGKPICVSPGCSVQLVSLQDENCCWLKLVSQPDARLEAGELPILSPLGQAILGKHIGAVVQLRVGHSPLRFLIADILRVQVHQPGNKA